jgi:hypothetical protein
MANPLAVIEKVAVDVEKKIVVGVEDVIHVASDVFKVLSDVKVLTPTFKAELATLLKDATPIVAALSPIVVSEGSNLAADLAAVAPVLTNLKLLVADFLTFLPTLRTAVEALAADVK